MSWPTGETDLRLVEHVYWHHLDTAAPHNDDYNTDSGSKQHQKCKMAAHVSETCGLHFCTSGESGDASSIFIYPLWS